MADSLQSYPPPDSGASLKTAILVGAVIAMLVANIYLYTQVDMLKTEISKVRESIATEVTELRQNSSATSAGHRKSIDTLKTELAEARRAAAAAASSAKNEAEVHADKIAKELEAAQQRQAQQVASQFTEVKEANNTANAKIENVNGEVTNVKSQVASTKSELDKTISNLSKVTGDLGVPSGYIATNSQELAALKRLNTGTTFNSPWRRGRPRKKSVTPLFF